MYYAQATAITRRAAARCLCGHSNQVRAIATQAQKRPGDISDAFASLSGLQSKPLPQRFAELKSRLIRGKEDAVLASWKRLLTHLREEVALIASAGSNVIPEIDYSAIKNGQISAKFHDQFKKRGVAVVRSVVPEKEALQWKQDIRDYFAQNPHTRAFPANNPQVLELYWSAAQIAARANPALLDAQRFLMSFWHSADPKAAISTNHPTSYADRLRIRLPGDNLFALGPHVDGGGVERWEENGYGLGRVYNAIFDGTWETYDPWEASCRLAAVSDRYQGVGACSMFRMAQGWLSLSTTSAFEGTLLVNPMLKATTAYLLLRPFFTPKREATGSKTDPAFLDASNWDLEKPFTSKLEGATPGHGQELNPVQHPHLQLEKTMIHVPTVRPGDYVAWHCDTIHAVDSVHRGKFDSSVLYIPACPLTEANARYLAKQRDAFREGLPGPDFGGGEGESNHVGRLKVDEVLQQMDEKGARAMGLQPWDVSGEHATAGVKDVLVKSNGILGF